MSKLQKRQEKGQETPREKDQEEVGLEFESGPVKFKVHGVGRAVALSVIFALTFLAACYFCPATRAANLDNGITGVAQALSTPSFGEESA